MRWAWPWAIGDGGLLGLDHDFWFSGGRVLPRRDPGGVFFLAALAVVGIWVPFGWWRVLAVRGAILSLLLMATFFGPTKLLSMALDLVVLWAAITKLHRPTDEDASQTSEP